MSKKNENAPILNAFIDMLALILGNISFYLMQILAGQPLTDLSLPALSGSLATLGGFLGLQRLPRWRNAKNNREKLMIIKETIDQLTADQKNQQSQIDISNLDNCLDHERFTKLFSLLRHRLAKLESSQSKPDQSLEKLQNDFRDHLQDHVEIYDPFARHIKEQFERYETHLISVSPEITDKIKSTALDYIHNIPSYPLGNLFKGRKKDFKKLIKLLERSGAAAITQPASIFGLGGIGKTRLAVEFACPTFGRHIFPSFFREILPFI